MTCPHCKTEITPVLYNDDIEVGWVCRCVTVVAVHVGEAEYGSQVYMSADYKQGAVRSNKCPNQPK